MTEPKSERKNKTISLTFRKTHDADLLHWLFKERKLKGEFSAYVRSLLRERMEAEKAGRQPGPGPPPVDAETLRTIIRQELARLHLQAGPAPQPPPPPNELAEVEANLASLF